MNESQTQTGAFLFVIELRVNFLWVEQIFQGRAPSKQQCLELAMLFARRVNIDSRAREFGLTQRTTEHRESDAVAWVRVLGHGLPPPLAAKIHEWEARGADVIHWS